MSLQANDILKVVVALAFPDSVVAQNIFWVLFEADGTSTDEDDVLDDLETWTEAIYDELVGLMSVDAQMDQMTVYVYDAVEDDFDEVGDRTVSGVGVAADEYLPLGVAAVSNAGTVDPDVKGRKFWGGLTEASNDDGGIASAAAGNFSLAVTEWITSFTGSATGSGFVPGVYSLTKSSFKAFEGGGETNLVYGYQRRRKPGVGI